MKFSVKSSVLKDALQVIRPVWKANIDPQILSTVLFAYRESGEVQLTCTDTEIQITTDIDVSPIKISDQTSMCLPGYVIFPLINYLSPTWKLSGQIRQW